MIAISAACFALFLTTTFITKVSLCCLLTKFLGKISLEIYVFQGAFMMLFHGKMLFIENAYLYVLLSAVCTIAIAVCVQPLNKKIYALFK